MHLMGVGFEAEVLRGGGETVGGVEEGFPLGVMALETSQALAGPASSSGKVTKVFSAICSREGGLGPSRS